MNTLAISLSTSAILVMAGLFIIITGKHGLRYLLGIMFIMNGSGLLLASFSLHFHGDLRGSSETFIVLIILALQAVTGTAIIINKRYGKEKRDGDGENPAEG